MGGKRLEITQVDSSIRPPRFHNMPHAAHAFPQVPRKVRLGIVEFLVVLIRVSLSLHDDTGVGGDTGPELSSLLTDRAGNGGSLHLTLGVDDLDDELAGWSYDEGSGDRAAYEEARRETSGFKRMLRHMCTSQEKCVLTTPALSSKYR